MEYYCYLSLKDSKEEGERVVMKTWTVTWLQKAEIMGRFAAAHSCALQLLIHGRRAGKMEWSELYHGWLVQGQTSSWVQLIKLTGFTVWKMRGWGGRSTTALLEPGQTVPVMPWTGYLEKRLDRVKKKISIY